MIRFEQVGKTYPDGTQALRDVSLGVPRGEFCVLLGHSGAGKSTLLRSVNGLVTPTAGHVLVDGVTVTRRTMRKVRRRVGMVHQQFNLTPRLSVLDNVIAGALPTISTWRTLLRWFPRAYQVKACQLLEQMKLEPAHMYRRAMHLSGGQQQRVAIARAFILDPAVVLADEPVASLDPASSRTILGLLKSESRRTGAAVLCSLHQVELAREFADRIVAMMDGAVVYDGPPQELDPATEARLYDQQRRQAQADGDLIEHHDPASPHHPAGPTELGGDGLP